MIQDAVVPRSRLPEVLAASYGIAKKYELRLANVFHAGDGNLHPFICFDSRSAEQVRDVKEAGRELMETCVAAGGTITGEHGVGFDKRDYLPLIFSEDDMATMLGVRAAFDPLGLCNPGKIIPMLRGCGEARAVTTPTTPAPPREQMTEASSSLGPRASRPHDPGAGSVESLKRAEPERRGVFSPAGNGSQRLEPDDAAKRLLAIVGEANVSLFPNARLPALLSVAPQSIEQASEVMKLAARGSWSVVPSGSATWLNAGNPVSSANVVINTMGLNQVLDHEPADLVASAQAGVTLQTFNQALAAGGQWLPLDPPDDGRSTLGGVVATGMAGAQKCGYGMPRNFVIGMRVVLPDGKIVKAGGRVVKNVAGYDLCKLFTGSYGTLGLIAELTFKLRPVPAKEVTVLARGSLEAVIRVAQSVHEARLFPVGLELVSRALGQSIGVEMADNDVLLLTRFAGIGKTVSYQVERAITHLQGEAGVSQIETESNDRNLWSRLAAAPMQLDEIISWRATVPTTRVGEFIGRVNEKYPLSISKSIWQAGIADGRIRVMEEPKLKTAAEESSRLTHLRTLAESFGGSLVIESATDEVKTTLNAWGPRGSSDSVMKRIKHELDPQGILSPGRFSGY